MDRRHFIKILAATPIIIPSTRTIIDLAANTYRNPPIAEADPYLRLLDQKIAELERRLKRSLEHDLLFGAARKGGKTMIFGHTIRDTVKRGTTSAELTIPNSLSQ